MPSIETRALLPADPDTVFGMIRKVEDFPRYTSAVERVTPIGPERYHWQVRISGVVYEWDVEVIQCEPPLRLAWRSLTGIANTGRYRLTPAPGGTDVTLVIDYSLNSRLLDHTVGRVAGPIVRRVSAEVLHRVRQRLASGQA
ncbi:Polyketide cyclase/dehydrase [Thioalkalivibrio nitratireducens DSM 14787]|uniref:Polyketide cyclase/dehydrase n=1 Tax=Thioalkalivibrio nitratireducens (strain DSM 14787 / UNIQEM 213 / ALEN2) TaxID=1255043 RepID=L0DVU7_THIND|nr:SRPBCC family protein [Thioalkalivibrio nitratireducens]AGA33724.1 Polyketide cyclase/dehydrase [Thioalkalivibrio nitratireducens DSM 14787]